MRSTTLRSLAVALIAYSGIVVNVQPFPFDYYEPTESNDDLKQVELFATQKPLGHVAGLAVDAQNRVVAFHRAERVWDESSFNDDEVFTQGPIKNKTIAIMDESGAIVDEFGEGLFYMPHGLTIDKNGDYWVTDVGAHQVHKIDAKSKKIVLTLGEKMKPGSDDKHFCKPTDVAVASNGAFFVADGYCNSRVMKFDAKGNLIAIINAAIEENQPSEFLVPHSLALIEETNTICVADRENERIQCFSAGLSPDHRHMPTGILITSASDIGRIYAIRERNQFIVGVIGQSEDVSPQVFMIDMTTSNSKTFAEGIENPHALAISPKGDVYVSQLEPNQIIKMSIA